MRPAELPITWRTAAETAERYGDARGAVLLRACAEELDSALRDQSTETLTLAEAALESGYSTDRLRHMIAEGKLPNLGAKGRPRIARGDLPRKPQAALGGFDAELAARRAMKRAG